LYWKDEEVVSIIASELVDLEIGIKDGRKDRFPHELLL